MRKVCKNCKEEKPLNEFYQHSECKFGVMPKCKVCLRTLCRKSSQKYRDENPEKARAACRAYKSKNRESLRNYWSTYKKANTKKVNSHNAAYRARKLRALPQWADLQAIQEFYEKCPEGQHVDHVIPLKGKNVCGLHVLENLQYLSAEANLKKGNKFNPFQLTNGV